MNSDQPKEEFQRMLAGLRPASDRKSTSIASTTTEVGAIPPRWSSSISGKLEGPSLPESIFGEFPEFSRKEVKTLASVFHHFDHDKDGHITLMELKLVMEKLEEAQCHIDIKGLIEKVTKEKGGKIRLADFLRAFQMVVGADNKMFHACIEKLADFIDVQQVGVKRAALYFEAKADELMGASSTRSHAERERLEEEKEKVRQEEEKKRKKEEFKKRIMAFQ